ncbi:hypothetical protein L6164_008529 [Bauhinia variegata]|uniref:Uncharacterized protein n=1 Tax=Bauhinia variegata TaxID=167791 RepID=A0ACB9PJU7_BAUVA|nr:hypothetical protein L6164_008529 [Bauhinia variegata]
MVETERREAEENRTMKRVFLILSTILLSIGTAGGPLIMRLYYIHGGNRIWLSSFLETAAFPIMFIPLAISYLCRPRHFTATQAQKPKLVSMKPRLFVAAAGIGIITGVDNYLYAYGLAQLPVSTSSLVISTRLVFTACFAFLLVRHKFTAVLGMGGRVDRPPGESTKDYVMGFVMTILASLLYGFILPLVELAYKKTKQVLTFSLVMETQLVMNAGATLFYIIGMIINNDFKVIPREEKELELGEAKYYVVLQFHEPVFASEKPEKFSDDGTCCIDRKVWVFALKTKDQVLDVFKHFDASVERETSRKLKCVRADNGGEYRGPLERYCKDHGIKLEKTVPKTSQ